jgi:hypothetical protein
LIVHKIKPESVTSSNQYLSPEQIQSALNLWLEGADIPDAPLYVAIRRTIEEGLFSASDVHFAVAHIRDSVSDEQPRKWLERVKSLLSQQQKDHLDHRITQDVLCLHAGNLPLVGFQDVLAVLLSGQGYAGKLSRKDPYLIASFIEILQKQYPWMRVKCSIDLNTYRNHKFQCWTFAGSDAGLSQVNHELLRQDIVTANSTSLQRTAHFSVAILAGWSSETKEHLLESILRYGGKGCRSVAMIFAQMRLAEVAGELSLAASVWFRVNSVTPQIPHVVRYRHAYNQSVGITSILVGSHLIQEGIASPDFPEIVYWQDMGQSGDALEKYRFAIQELYVDTTNDDKYSAQLPSVSSLLRSAQRPPLDWKPDGVDILSWLLEQNAMLRRS